MLVCMNLLLLKIIYVFAYMHDIQFLGWASELGGGGGDDDVHRAGCA